MAASTNINGWVTVEYICTSQGQVWETVFNYRGPAHFITEGELQTFVNAWAGIMNPLLLPLINPAVSVQEIRAKTHHKDFTNTQASWLPTVFTPGTGVGEVLPGNVALVVKLLTGAVGRSRRGRQYMFGLGENVANGNIVLSGYLSALAVAFTRHLLGFTAASNAYIPAIASRKLALLFDVLSFGIEAYVDSQRRRLTGRGQ